MIIAVDFDGILCDNAFPDIGVPHYETISQIRHLIDLGAEVVLWTSRTSMELVAAVQWCNDRGLHFAAVNENAPSNLEKYRAKYPNGTRKVYADYYVDDHNIEFATEASLTSEARLENMLNRLIERLKKERDLECQEEN